MIIAVLVKNAKQNLISKILVLESLREFLIVIDFGAISHSVKIQREWIFQFSTLQSIEIT